MAEGLNLSREDEEPKSPETDDDDEEDSSSSKSTSKKSVGRAGLGGLFKSAERTNEAPKEKELKGFDRLLETFKVDTKAEKSDAGAPKSEQKAELARSEVAAEDPDTTLPEVAPDAVETYDLRKDQVGAGEFIVNLHQASPAETVEIPMDGSDQETHEKENEVKDNGGEDAVPGETLSEESVDSPEESPEASSEDDDDGAAQQPQATSQTTNQTRQQPKQQQKRVATTPPPPPPPPVTQTLSTPPPPPRAPYPQRTPYQQQYQHNILQTVQPNPNVVQTTQNTKEVEDAEYYGRRQGRREGLFAGLVVGGGIEHIRHKRREKRMEKRHNEVVKKHEQLAENAKWDNIRERDAEKTRAEFAAKFAPAEKPKGLQRVPEVTATSTTPERPITTVVRESHELRSAAAVERIKHEITRETTKIERAAEVENERRHETLDVPEGHRVERSAWHTVELDEHGHPVENSVLEYGKEYYRERAHEAAPVDKATVKSAAAGVAMAGVSASLNDSQSHADVSKASTPPAPQGIVTEGQAKKALKAVTSPPTTPTGTIIWGAVLLVILIILSFILL
jgi:hypothetical protein